MKGWFEQLRRFLQMLWPGSEGGMSQEQPTPPSPPLEAESRPTHLETDESPSSGEEPWWYDEDLIQRIIERVRRL